jgi:hypothetical protein
LRYIVCATRELLEDSGTDVEGWMLFEARIGGTVLCPNAARLLRVR